MPHIDYYLFTKSPFTYLAGTRLEQVAARHGATITYKPVDLPRLFARTGGLLPPDRHLSRQEYRLQELTRVAAERGLPINLKPAFGGANAAPAAYALIAAQSAGGGDLGRLAHAFNRSVWADERDVGDNGVIRACLQEAGFDASLADSGLLEGAETYERNLEEAVAAGVFGAPFYIADDGQRFWGQDRIDDLDRNLAGRG